MNLLLETIDNLILFGKTPCDVRWVGSCSGIYAMSWDEFAKIANIEYDEGFGGQEIARDLVVVGDNWWMERHEYDGSENWKFKRIPKKCMNAESFTNVSGGSWDSLDELN